MLTKEKIEEYNRTVLFRLSRYLNNCPDAITAEMVYQAAEDCGFGIEQAFKVLLSGALEFYNNKEIMNGYINEKNTVKLLDPKMCEDDPYYSNIKLQNIEYGEWKTEIKKYAPFELFAYDDLKKLPDGRILPRVGFFEKEFSYPCILQNGREWMLVTPNEITTMRQPIKEAHGRVVTYGLGLGYFAYMAALKPEVENVTVVEKDETVIALFNEHILPQMSVRDKIKIHHGDALIFASEQKTAKKSDFDYVYADTWHDPLDGTEMYVLLKMLERKDTQYAYWIEDTIKCYL